MKRLSDLPKALTISIVSVILFYVFLNISYLTVLGPVALLESEAVGASFANKIYPGLEKFISFANGQTMILAFWPLWPVWRRPGPFDPLDLLALRASSARALAF